MKNFFIFLLSSMLVTSVFAANFTADRHTARGIECTSCHREMNTDLPVRQQTCLKCHGGSYAAVAQRTKKVVPNPHFNHFGDRDCSTCHKGHQPSAPTCSQCHKFDLKMPSDEK